MIRPATLLAFLAYYLVLPAQGLTGSLRSLEDSISSTVRASIKASDDADKLIVNDHLNKLMETALNEQGSWEFPFDSLRKFRMMLESPDKELRIYNWAIQMGDKSYRYFCYLQHYEKKNRKWSLIRLNDKSDEIKNPESLQLDENKWFGAFYNTIIVTKKKGKKIYTLLGWDGNDRLTQKKLIETLYFNNGKALFGEPIIQVEKDMGKGKKIIVFQRRLIFEYKQGVFMNLKWHPKEELIIFDVLGPTDSSKKGQFSDYGPTLALDGYKFEKGKWMLIKDPEGKNEKTEKDKDYKDPQNH